MDALQNPNTQKRCPLVHPIRETNGKLSFRENPEILEEVYNLGREMLVRFEDGSTTFLFPHEIAIAEVVCS